MGRVMSEAELRHSALATVGSEAEEYASLVDAPLSPVAVHGVGAEVARLRLRDRLFGERNAPTRVGRYVVLRELGEGGMGVVFSAHDPELDRRVAVKLMRTSGDASGLANARLVREAQSIARVADPNVIAVYEVGEDAGRVYIAMEHVEGQTLRAWLRERPRPWPEVLAMLLQAARGLAAGHAASVIHRDFKPENAMVGNDGRLRVLDFGLARSGEDRVPDPTLVDVGDDVMTTALTPAGVAVGTPAYMAPEQFSGIRADILSDQFSFCVALFEGLYGLRPFVGKTVAALRLAACNGEVVTVPKTTVPPRLREILLRGLNPEASRRWPDMRALIDELERFVGRRRTLRTVGVLGLAGASVAALTGALAWNMSAVGPESLVCTAGADRAARAWSEPRREQVASAFTAAAPGAADDATRTVDEGVSRYLEGWNAAYVDACTGADRSTPEGQTRLDLQMACLDTRLAEVRALVDVWTQADAGAVQRAAVAIEGLEPVSRCAEVDLSSAPPTHLAATLSALTDELARAKALRATGRYREGLALAEELLPRALELGHVPTSIEVRRMVGLLQHDTGDFAAAAITDEQTYEEARSARQDRAAFEAALELVTVYGDRLSRHEDAMRWSRHAAAALDNAPPDLEARGRLLAQTGLVRYLAGEETAAIEDQTQALALLEQAEAEPRMLVAAHANLGMALRGIDRPDEALDHYRRALEVIEANMAPESLELAHILDGRAGAYFDQRKLDEAEADYRHALAIRERVLGPEHSFVAASSSGLGSTLVAQGRLDEALAAHQRAVGIVEAKMGPDHPLTATAIINLAGVYIARDEHDEALRLARRGMGIVERALGPTHRDMMAALGNVIYLEDVLGHYAEVEVLLVRLLELKREHLGPADPSVLESERDLAVVRAAVAKAR